MLSIRNKDDMPPLEADRPANVRNTTVANTSSAGTTTPTTVAPAVVTVPFGVKSTTTPSKAAPISQPQQKQPGSAASTKSTTATPSTSSSQSNSNIFERMRKMNDEQLSKDADREVYCKNYSDAILLWQEAERRQPHEAHIKVSLAFALEQANKITDAIKVIRSARPLVGKRSAMSSLLLAEARCKSKLGEKDLALELLSDALKENNKNQAASNLMREIRNELKKTSSRKQSRSRSRSRDRRRSRSRSRDRRSRSRSRSRDRRSKSRSRSRDRKVHNSRSLHNIPIRPNKKNESPTPLPTQIEMSRMSTNELISLSRDFRASEQQLKAIEVDTCLINGPHKKQSNHTRLIAFISRAYSREKLKDFKQAMNDLDSATELLKNGTNKGMKEDMNTKRRITLARARINEQLDFNYNGLDLVNEILKEEEYIHALILRAKLYSKTGQPALELADNKRIRELNTGATPRPGSGANKENIHGKEMKSVGSAVPLPATKVAIAPTVAPVPIVPATKSILSAKTVPVAQQQQHFPVAAQQYFVTSENNNNKSSFAGWNPLKLGDWFASHGEPYKGYTELVVQNCLDGNTLESFCKDGEKAVEKVIVDLGITNQIHQRVLISRIMAAQKK